MANVHAAIKQIRKDVKKRFRNQATHSELHTLWKRFSEFTQSQPAQAPALARTLTSKWDRAVSRGVVPRKRANRKKARIALALKKLQKKSN